MTINGTWIRSIDVKRKYISSNINNWSWKAMDYCVIGCNGRWFKITPICCAQRKMIAKEFREFTKRHCPHEKKKKKCLDEWGSLHPVDCRSDTAKTQLQESKSLVFAIPPGLHKNCTACRCLLECTVQSRASHPPIYTVGWRDIFLYLALFFRLYNYVAKYTCSQYWGKMRVRLCDWIIWSVRRCLCKNSNLQSMLLYQPSIPVRELICLLNK